MVVKADTATVRIPELEFEIPSHTQKGRITTIESILMESIEGLEREQPVRKVSSPVLQYRPDTKYDVFVLHMR